MATTLSHEIASPVRGLQTRKNRNRFQIAQAILEVAKEGAGKTRIMYRANLSFRLLEDYLTALVKSGLLKVKEGERKIYMTSERGLQFLREFQDLERHVALVTAKRDSLVKMLAQGS
jgi:predicted transcriptional regulator